MPGRPAPSVGGASVVGAGTVRAQPLAGPMLPPTAVLAAMTAEQLIGEIARHISSTSATSYAMGLCYKELSQPSRYQDELGFDTFEDLLAARGLPTRMTAYKLISVVSTYSERDVKQLGGMDKTYKFLRLLKLKGAPTDVKSAQNLSIKLFGRPLNLVPTSEVEAAARGESVQSKPSLSAAKKASSRLGSALRRVGLKVRMRTHHHGGPCVNAHLTPEHANAIADMMAELLKLRKRAT